MSFAGAGGSYGGSAELKLGAATFIASAALKIGAATFMALAALKLGAAKILVSAGLKPGAATCGVETAIACPLSVLRRPERQQLPVADVVPAAGH